MKYPIDSQTTEKFFSHLMAHDRAQRQMIQALTLLLTEAIGDSTKYYPAEEMEWHQEAHKLLDLQKKLSVEHENRIFNEKNGVAEKTSNIIATQESYADIMPSLGFMGLSGQIEDPKLNANINEREKVLGEEMSEEEIARLFREKPKRAAKDDIDMSKKEPFKGMTLEEIKEWERKQDNANDIYKVKARVQNLVAATGGSLTAVGEMMVNSFVHVAKDLYDFAEHIPDQSLKIQLIERVRKHEGMPANLISAVNAGVKIKK